MAGAVMRIGSLFSGAAGLDRAVESVFGATTAWHCELDPAASKVLALRYPGVPNHRDITTTDWANVEPVDIICGGFPCQDVSSAGKRAGIKDGTRSGLWSYYTEAIDVLRPRYVVIENVRGLLSATAHRAVESGEDGVGDGHAQLVLRAIGAVLGDLADIGYDAQWATVSAASVGAPHRRDRVFIVATPADTQHGTGDREWLASVVGGSPCPSSVRDVSVGEARRGRQGGGDVGRIQPLERRGTNRAGRAYTDTTRDGWDEGWPESAGVVGGSNAAVRSHGGNVDLLPTPSVADGTGGHLNRSGDRGGELLLPHANGDLLPTPRKSDGDGGCNPLSTAERMDDVETRIIRIGPQWGKYAPAIARWESITRPAPSPTEPNRNGNPRLSAAFSEWLMGWPEGWVTDVPDVSRNDQLRIVGNGVVPQCAEAALRWLLNVSDVAA